jgi:valyl-tRNA synthetase
MRLVKGWPVADALPQPAMNKVSVEWFDSVLNATLDNINALYDDYRLSEALMATYKLVWDDFCSWFLEMVKPAYQQPIDSATLTAVNGFFEKLLKILHPFMPFITEEIWQLLDERKPGDSIMISALPLPGSYDRDLMTRFAFAEEVIMALRNFRKEKNIPQKEAIRLFIRKNNQEQADTLFDPLVCKLCNINELEYVTEKVEGSQTCVVGATEFFIPMPGQINAEEELQKLREELDYTFGFLAKVMQKLNNESFVGNAPASVVDTERKKRDDAEARIRVLQEQISELEM